MADDPTGTNFANNGAILMTLLSVGALAFSQVMRSRRLRRRRADDGGYEHAGRS